MTHTEKQIEEILEEVYVELETHTRLNGLNAEDSDGIELVLGSLRTTLTSFVAEVRREERQSIYADIAAFSINDDQKTRMLLDYLKALDLSDPTVANPKNIS